MATDRELGQLIAEVSGLRDDFAESRGLMREQVNSLNGEIHELVDAMHKMFDEGKSVHANLAERITILETELGNRPSYRAVLTWLVGAMVVAQGMAIGVLPLILD